MNEKESDQLVILPLHDLIWDILGDDDNGISCATITPTTAKLLSQQLTNSLKWKVEFHDEEGNELINPVLWRYSEWKNSLATYERQKKFAHNRRVEGWILDKNIDNLARAISKANKMPPEQARPIAFAIINKGAGMEVLDVFGVEETNNERGGVVITMVFPIIFRRKQNSKPERGIAIGDEGCCEIIVDKKFKLVKEVWNYTPLQSEGCLPIDLG